VTTGHRRRLGRDNWRFEVKNRCASDETDSRMINHLLPIEVEVK
jgi:hypothetical protein